MNRLLGLIALLTVSFGSAVFGQTITGSITGTVTDSSGAVVPDVRITATNTETNASNNVQTNSSGIYNLVFLPVGNYTVTAEGKGFKKSILGPFKLEVDQTARVDIALQVGQLTDTVEIHDIAPTLQTESASTGDVITSRQATEIPLRGRNFSSLTLLVPGAITPNPQSFEGVGRNSGGGRAYVNGNREQTNNYLLDGADINESIDNLVGYSPSVDAVEEVKVGTGNNGAEFGNANGAVVNMTLKSGTNQFHGNVFEFLQNDKLNANGFFGNRAGAKRRAFKRNVFGGTLGGPVIKNRLFFFMDYQGGHERSSGPATNSVAPLAWRTGDLSSLNRKITDPTTGQPFPGGIIPQNRIVNPVAKAIFANSKLYPAPNNIGSGVAGQTNNYIGSSASFTDNDQADAKIDFRVTDKDNLSGRFTIARARQGTSAVVTPYTIPNAQTGPTTGGVINWTRTISPTMVNEARIAFNRVRITDVPTDVAGLLGANGNQSLGIPGGQPAAGLSSIAVGDGLTSLGAIGTASDSITNAFQYGDTFTKQAGRHFLKIGGQAIRYQQNRFYAGNNGIFGYFTYDGRYTGSAFADFLLDDLGQKGRGSATGKWGHRQWRSALFVQDDFKVNPSLTLNLGLRWEYSQPIYEVADRQLNVNINTGVVSYAGKNGASRALYNPYYKQFMPRFGFAWSPEHLFGDKKFVVRGGYGITSYLEGTGANLRLTLNPPYFFESDVTYSTTQPGSITSGFTGLVGHDQLSGQIRAWNPDLRPAFIQEYNLSTEFQLMSSMSLTVGYVGQKGTHLVDPREGNQAPLGSGLTPGTTIDQFRPLAGVLPGVGQISYTDSSATMNYNALQASLRKRFSKGLEFIASYTLSKTMSDNLGYYGSSFVSGPSAYWQNANDRKADYGPAFFDARHNFSLGGSYELPYGHNRMFGSSSPRAVDAVLGGWQVGYVISAHTGFPLTLTSANRSNSGNRTARSNHYRPLNIVGQNIDHWFGTDPSAVPCTTDVDNGVCAYGAEKTNTFGTSGISTERAPGYENFDLTLGKKFTITERKYLEFRSEFFNAFNSVSFGPPDRTVTSATFGQITSQVNTPRVIQFGLKFFF